MATTVLRVYSYEPSLKKSKQKCTIPLKLAAGKDLSTINLEDIRGILAENKVYEGPDSKAPFCNTEGAEMSDDMTFNMYKSQLDDPEETTPSTTMIKIYYKKKKMKRDLDNVATEFLKKKLDLKLKAAPELKDVRAEILASAFKGSEWKAATSGERAIAGNLTERDWSVILRTNCLLSGHKLVFREVETVDKQKKMVPNGIAGTPFNAFKLKPRKFSSYEVVAPPPAVNGVVGIQDQELLFHIPRFRVDDAASIDVRETRNTVESSLAKSSFSKTSVEASGGGGFWGVSAAAKAGYSDSSIEKEINGNSENKHETHVSYNFPRATIFLDAQSLELTPEVKKDILKVRCKNSLKAFGDKYGDIFSRRAAVGGKLTSTTHIKSTCKLSQTERENSLKKSAAASVSGVYGSASAEGSRDSGDKRKEAETKQGFDSTVTWQATGGDTTLSNNPPKWCGTVGNFYNWRIVEHDDPVPLSDIISTFEGFGYVKELFKSASQTESPAYHGNYL